jgi:hypothetical protein
MTMTLETAHHQGVGTVQRHLARFVELARALSSEERAAAIPDSTWTVAETVGHVRAVVLRYTTDLRRAEGPAAVGAQNAADLERLGSDVDEAAAAIEEESERLAVGVELFAPEDPLPFHAGQTITLAGGWGNLLGELLAHGDDLARATGRSFAVPSEDLEVLWRFTTPVLQGWLRPDAPEGTWRLRFGFGDLDAELLGGQLRWGPELLAEPAAIIDVPDAAALALAFPYGRRPLGDPDLARLAGCFLPL